MAITWSSVLDIAPELSTVPTGTQNAILAQANTELSTTVWGTRIEIGRAWLAAHLGTIAKRRGVGGPVVSESVGQVSRAYATSIAAGAAQLGSTVYGLEFERLLMQLPGARFTVSG